jgi:hypothetical protein
MEKKYVFIISPNPIDFVGSETKLGEVLQTYFKEMMGAFTQFTHVGPPLWPLPIVPPVPILQGGAQNSIKAKVVKATNKAMANLKKVLTGG